MKITASKEIFISLNTESDRSVDKYHYFLQFLKVKDKIYILCEKHNCQNFAAFEQTQLDAGNLTELEKIVNIYNPDNC